MRRSSEATDGHRNRNRRIRTVFVLLGLAALVVGLAYLQALPGGLVGVAIFGAPLFLGYFFGVRSLAGSVFVGLSVVAICIMTTLYVIDERHSSTVGLSYLFLPLVGIPLVLAGVLLDRATRSPARSVVAGTVMLSLTIGAMLYWTLGSAAEGFCDHANGLGNAMIEVGPGPLTVSEADRLVEFQNDFMSDSTRLREAGMPESAHAAQVWGDALADLGAAGTQEERNQAHEHLQRVVRELYGSTGSCPDLR